MGDIKYLYPYVVVLNKWEWPPCKMEDMKDRWIPLDPDYIKVIDNGYPYYTFKADSWVN